MTPEEFRNWILAFKTRPDLGLHEPDNDSNPDPEYIKSLQDFCQGAFMKPSNALSVEIIIRCHFCETEDRILAPAGRFTPGQVLNQDHLPGACPQDALSAPQRDQADD